MKTKLFYLVLVAILAATTLGFMPSGTSYSPPVDDRVGGIDFDQYCRSIGATHHGIDVNKGRDGVYCQFDSGGPIRWLGKGDIDQACRNQYGNSAYAAHDGSNHPYAWYCAKPSSSQPSGNSNSQPSGNNATQNQGSQPSQPQSSSNTGTNTTTIACSGYTKDFLSGQSTPPSGKYLSTGYDKVLLRSGRGQDKCSYGWLTKGKYYPVLAEQSGWIKTRAGGLEGWVMASYVTTDQGSNTNSSATNSNSNSPSTQKTCETAVKAHYRLSRGGFIIEIPKVVKEPYEILYKGSVVPDAGNGVQHKGWAGEATDTAFFLGISTRFSALHTNGVLVDSNWKVRYPCQ